MRDAILAPFSSEISPGPAVPCEDDRRCCHCTPGAVTSNRRHDRHLAGTLNVLGRHLVTAVSRSLHSLSIFGRWFWLGRAIRHSSPLNRRSASFCPSLNADRCHRPYQEYLRPDLVFATQRSVARGLTRPSGPRCLRQSESL